MQEQPTSPQKPRVSWAWWLLFAALMIWNLWFFWSRSQPEASLPYSAFLDQVKADNVTNIQISGSEITGKFRKPVPWPFSPALAPTETGAALLSPPVDAVQAL